MRKSKFKVGDKVRVLDGRKIHSDKFIFRPEMEKYFGKICTVVETKTFPDDYSYYTVSCDGDSIKIPAYYEKWMERIQNETIVVYRNGQEVIAYDKVSKQKAVAKCSPEDKFDFKTGAKLAFDRLMNGQEEDEPEEKLLNGKFVCITSSCAHLTKGKIYEFVDGYISYDDGKRMLLSNNPCRDIEDLKWFFGEDTFIEVVE